MFVDVVADHCVERVFSKRKCFPGGSGKGGRLGSYGVGCGVRRRCRIDVRTHDESALHREGAGDRAGGAADVQHAAATQVQTAEDRKRGRYASAAADTSRGIMEKSKAVEAARVTMLRQHGASGLAIEQPHARGDEDDQNVTSGQPDVRHQ